MLGSRLLSCEVLSRPFSLSSPEHWTYVLLSEQLRSKHSTQWLRFCFSLLSGAVSMVQLVWLGNGGQLARNCTCLCRSQKKSGSSEWNVQSIGLDPGRPG